MEITGTYHLSLVAISILAACGAAFVAVSTVPRIHRVCEPCKSTLWSLAFGLSLGSGIWSMHFIAMLALQLPIPMQFDIPLTVFSLLVAIGFTTLGILPFRQGRRLAGDGVIGPRLLGTGALMGLGISGMHYTGMAALSVPAEMRYDPLLEAASILIAIAASTAALYFADQLRNAPIFANTHQKAAVSLLMGGAVAGMHYTGMAALSFFSVPESAASGGGVDTMPLVLAVVIVGGIVQAGVLLAAERSEAGQAWQSSRDTEANLLNLLSIMPDGILVQIDDSVVFANPVALSLLGLDQDTLLGSRMSDFFPPENRDVIRHWMDDTLQSGQPTPAGKERMLRRDGSSMEVRMSAMPVRWNGRPAVQLMLHDLTGEKRRVSELARLITAVNHASDIIFSLDAQGCVLTVNRTGLEFIGLPLEQLQGKPFNDFLPPESKAVANEMFAKKARGETEHTHYELMMRDHTGKAHDMEVRTRSIIEEQRFAGVVAVARDVTLEREQQTKMEHTQRLESLGVLAGGIAHDFNNLLTAILGNASLAERKMARGETEDIVAYLGHIVNSSEKAAELCRQMLAYSGKGRFVVRPINLSQLVDEVRNLLGVSIAKNVTLNVNLAADLPKVQADMAQMQQVIMNLLINASDAIGENSGTITVTTGVTLADASLLREAHATDDVEPGEFVFIEVTDTGCGMKSHVKEKLFDPFFTTKFTGRGLGMSAVLGIVRGHHGAIHVDSAPGIGTTFRVLLPACDTAGIPEDIPAEAMDHEPLSGTVLIVDDEQVVRETAGLMLRDMGFSILEATDGADGLRVFASQVDDIVLVLLDMTMPHMDGKACFVELKAMRPEVKVILSSGYNEQETTNRFSEQNPDGFIQKPYTRDALQAKVREVLNG